MKVMHKFSNMYFLPTKANLAVALLSPHLPAAGFNNELPLRNISWVQADYFGPLLSCSMEL